MVIPSKAGAARRRNAPPAPLDIRDVQTIKHDRVFFLCNRFGDIPEGNTSALGLYFLDTRFLSQYELFVNGRRPLFLHAEVDRNYSMLIETMLPVVSVDPSGRKTSKNMPITRHRWLEHGLHETVKVHNFGREVRSITIELVFSADFRDLFEVRGFKRKKRGSMNAPEVTADRVTLGYLGLDAVDRTLALHFSPAPTALSAVSATYKLELGAREETEIQISLRPAAGKEKPGHNTYKDLEQDYSQWRRSCTRFKTSHVQLQNYLDRAILDLRMMQTDLHGSPVIDAGVPWFSTLFGRDALITAYQAMTVNTDLAKSTVKTLAKHQGVNTDSWREEEPGKILHELRHGELAATGEIPHTPYYGSIDSTPLWLLVYGRVWAWTADRSFAESLWPNVLKALEWIEKHGDSDGDGYLEYQKKSKGGLDNQGWKDSFDGVVHSDGSIPKPPIALVEVQGYVYDAKRQVAQVARALGHQDIAAQLEAEAEKLKHSFNRDFWMEKERYFAVALDGDKRQVRSITSNPGHALWSRVIDEDKVPAVIETLLSPRMASGWGIRTLSSDNPAFDPVGYHTGTIWPHDCSLIAHGMKLNGFDDESNLIVDQLALAGGFFAAGRFPELFCGFAREEVPIPVEYPVACRPQAWATGATLLMVRSYGGIHADAPNRTLQIVRPKLPFWLEENDIIGLKVGDATVDLHFRSNHGVTSCHVANKQGDLDVLIRA